jgi:hypothetical protein
MAVDEQWLRVRRSLEEKLGVEEASFLMDRPPGGWSELVTTRTLDLRFDAFEARMDVRMDARFGEVNERFARIEGVLEAIAARFGETDQKIVAAEERVLALLDRRFAELSWKLVSAVIAGMGVMGALFGVLVLVARTV